MKWSRRVLTFLALFFIYHVGFGCNVFPVDENNVLQAPSWYPILGISLSVAITIIFENLARSRKPIIAGIIKGGTTQKGNPSNQNSASHVPRIKAKRNNRPMDRVDPLGERNHVSDQEVDALYKRAISIVLETNSASMSMLQRRLNISFNNAKCLIDRMEQDGIIGPYVEKAPREILASKNHTNQRSTSSINIDQIIREEEEWRRAQQGLSPIDYELEKVDGMDGPSFEYWCADLLKAIGFQNVEVTQGSGDQGVDILANRDGIKYAIQCKRYSSDLGNKPVQEVNTGQAIYHCQIGAVMTNRYFTIGGKEAAEATGVLLWDRDKLKEMLKHSLGVT